MDILQVIYTMSEDTVPTSYKYAWSDKSESTLQDFLTKVSSQYCPRELLLLSLSAY